MARFAAGRRSVDSPTGVNAERVTWANELGQLADRYRAWTFDFDRACAGVHDRDLLSSVLVRAVDIARDFRHTLNVAGHLDIALARDLDQNLTRDLESGHIPVGLPALGLASYLERTSMELLVSGDSAGARALTCLALLLPADRRWRWVAEVMGDLGVCGSRMERIRYVAGIVGSLPRLAWMMNHRGRV